MTKWAACCCLGTSLAGRRGATLSGSISLAIQFGWGQLRAREVEGGGAFGLTLGRLSVDFAAILATKFGGPTTQRKLYPAGEAPFWPFWWAETSERKGSQIARGQWLPIGGNLAQF